MSKKAICVEVTCELKPGRSKDQATAEGFIYNFNRKYKDTTYYLCEYTKMGCSARLTVYPTRALRSGTHVNHMSDPSRVKALTVKSQLKKEAVENPTVPVQAIVKKMNNLLVNEPESVSAFGPTSYFENDIRRARRIASGNANNTVNQLDRNQYVIPDELRTTPSGGNFVLFEGVGERSKDQMIILSTSKSLQILAESATVIMDGTFKSCPTIYYQLYTLHAIHLEHSIPLVYAFLPGKSRNVYLDLFYKISELSTFLNGEIIAPQYIILDFELAAKQAAEEVFPQSQVCGCLFHLSQSVWRNVQLIPELLKLYIETSPAGLETRRVVRSLAALSFVPEEQVKEVFDELKGVLPLNHPVKGLLGYFFRNYINSPNTFPISFWNVYTRVLDNVPRTQNSAEGWHFRLNNNLGASHPQINKAIDNLRNEELYWEQEIVKLSAGLNRRDRRVKYRNLDSRVLRVVNTFSSVPHLEYLYSLSSFIHNFSAVGGLEREVISNDSDSEQSSEHEDDASTQPLPMNQEIQEIHDTLTQPTDSETDEENSNTSTPIQRTPILQRLRKRKTPAATALKPKRPRIKK